MRQGQFAGDPKREPIRAWSLSAVERLHFPDGATAIFKFAAEPFTGEDRALKLAAVHGVPVSALYGAAVSGEILGMVMEDLGEPREANDEDGARAAVVLARAFNGAGVLDLASWPGTQQPANPARPHRVIRGRPWPLGCAGLPAEAWALGWHRVWIVEWFMDQAVHWINDPTTDPAYMRAVRRHLREATHLLEL